MTEAEQKVLINLIESFRDLTFDVNFCLAILKEDDNIAKLYKKCKEKFEAQKIRTKEGNE